MKPYFEKSAVLFSQDSAQAQNTRASQEKRFFRVASEGAIHDVKGFIEDIGDINARDDSGSTLLHCACFNPSPDTALYLLENGAATNTRNKWGEAPLHIASRLGHVKVSDVLIKFGADINAQDGSGRTPLNWACRSGSIEMIHFLLLRGANTEIKDKYGATAVEYAIAPDRNKTNSANIVGTFLRYRKSAVMPQPSDVVI